jgi:hypothetical protein
MNSLERLCELYVAVADLQDALDRCERLLDAAAGADEPADEALQRLLQVLHFAIDGVHEGAPAGVPLH